MFILGILFLQLLYTFFKGYIRLPEDLFLSIFIIISIRGISQLFKGKKDGMITLLLNSTTFYLWRLTESFSTLKAYGLLLFCYLPIILLLYFLHKKDSTSHLAWNKMQKNSIKRPKRMFIWITTIFVFLTFAIPFIYSQCMGIKSYNVRAADRFTMNSLYAIMGNEFSAEWIADSYLPNGEVHVFDLESDPSKALWWYRLSNNYAGVTYCLDYIEAQENGFCTSDRYGICSINPDNKQLVKIGIEDFSTNSLESNKYYNINLIGADISQGRLEIEGADFVENRLKNIQGDSVILRFIYSNNGFDRTLSQRVIPVKKVQSTLSIYPNDETFTLGREYTVKVNHPIEDAKWDLYCDKRVSIIKIDESSDSIKFTTEFINSSKIPATKFDLGDMGIKYTVNGNTISSIRLKSNRLKGL